MTNLNESFEKFAEIQQQGLAPVRELTSVAFQTFEQLARKNYALAGDVLEFAVAQAKLPIDVSEPNKLFEAQVAHGKAFAEKLSTRASEYAELGQKFQEEAGEVIQKEGKKVAKKATSKKAA